MPRLNRRALLVAAALCSSTGAALDLDAEESEPHRSFRSAGRGRDSSHFLALQAPAASPLLPRKTAPWAGAGGALLVLGWSIHRLVRAGLRKHAGWVERKVQERTRELERANAAKTEFVARIHHDIRNPINGVLGLARALEDTELSEEQRRLTGTIRQCATFLTTLADEVLDFAALESGHLNLHPAPFELANLLSASVTTVSPQLQAAGCTVRLDLDPKLPTHMLGDGGRIQQILVNFLTNAAKFGSGGEILVSAERLHALSGETVVRLAVHDQGPGVPPEEQTLIFEQFRQGQAAIAGRIKGSGLGLATARLLAERMGGRIGVENNPRKGACFRIEIPLAHAPAVQAPDATAIPGAGLQRALVVEDEEYNALSLTAMLRKLGYSVDRAGDGVSGLDQLRRNRYDVAFIDCELPGMSGVELARQFRSEASVGTQTLLVATTAYSSPSVRRTCLEAGMDEFLPKPLTPANITEAVGRHAGERASPEPEPAPVAVAEDGGEPDFGLLEFLADGNPALLRTKAEEFVTTCENELAALGAAVSRHHQPEFYPLAHRFLGQCRFIGAAQLSALAERMQQLPPETPVEVAALLYRQICAEFDRIRNKLRSHLDARETARGQSQSRT